MGGSLRALQSLLSQEQCSSRVFRLAKNGHEKTPKSQMDGSILNSRPARKRSKAGCSIVPLGRSSEVNSDVVPETGGRESDSVVALVDEVERWVGL